MFENCEINRPITINTCRACLETKTDGCVFLKHGNDMSQLYEFCVGIPVKPDDMLQLLCNTCAMAIKEFANFKKQCHASEALWKSITYQESKCPTINEIKMEDIECVFNAPDFSQDEQSNDNIQDITSNTLTKEVEYMLEKAKTKKNTIPNICDENKKLNITYKQEIDENESDNENDLKRGLIKVLECSKCKKQYQKTKCLIKHMTQSCYKEVNLNKLVIIKKYRPAVSKDGDTPSELFCGICHFTSSSPSDLKLHLSQHWENNDLHCKICGYIGRDLAELLGHRSVHQPYEFFSKLPNRMCHICNQRSVTIMRLQFHYRSAHLNKNGGLCSVCGKTFRSYTSWRNHEKLHRGSRYICDLCGNKFLYRNQIKSHLADHSDIRGHVCDICGKTFKRASYLKEHFNTVHTKEPVKCTHCDKTFKCPAHLKKHLKYVNEVKNFQCDVCYKHFGTQTSLKNHMFWHTDERPYSCDKCNAKYKAKSYLKIHMRKHTGQRPYSCEQCDKCFPTTMQLKRHYSVHNRDRPYKCTICNCSFYSKKMLIMHTTSKHKTWRSQT